MVPVVNKTKEKIPDFKHRLGELVAKHGGRSEVARALGVNTYTFTNWENGRTEPSLRMLCTLALFFEVEVGYLLGVKNTFYEEANRLDVGPHFHRWQVDRTHEAEAATIDAVESM